MCVCLDAFMYIYALDVFMCVCVCVFDVFLWVSLGAIVCLDRLTSVCV